MAEGNLRAAIRRFPGVARQIEELAGRSILFCELCEDLAEAESALARAEVAPADLREEQVAEWRSWIDTLTSEIERALKEGRVVPFRKPSKY